MAITTGQSQIYEGTATTTVKALGYNGGKNWVARYAFTTGATGASAVSWSIQHNYLGGGTMPALRWYMTTSSSSHINAGASTTAYHGTVTKTDAGGGDYTLSGSANIVLLPNTTYYLWIFPSTTTYGFLNLTNSQTGSVEVSGGAGLVYIDNGTTLEAYQAYIDNGSGWDLYMPYVDNGSSFDLMTG